MKLDRRARLRYGASLCLVLWLLSLPLPAVDVAGGPELSGVRVLREGWRAADSGVLAWFANPLFLISCAFGFLNRPKLASPVAGTALVLALTSFAAQAIARTGGASVPELRFELGFYVWLLAVSVWCVWAAMQLRQPSAAQ